MPNSSSRSAGANGKERQDNLAREAEVRTATQPQSGNNAVSNTQTVSIPQHGAVQEVTDEDWRTFIAQPDLDFEHWLHTGNDNATLTSHNLSRPNLSPWRVIRLSRVRVARVQNRWMNCWGFMLRTTLDLIQTVSPSKMYWMVSNTQAKHHIFKAKDAMINLFDVVWIASDINTSPPPQPQAPYKHAQENQMIHDQSQSDSPPSASAVHSEWANPWAVPVVLDRDLPSIIQGNSTSKQSRHEFLTAVHCGSRRQSSTTRPTMSPNTPLTVTSQPFPVSDNCLNSPSPSAPQPLRRQITP